MPSNIGVGFDPGVGVGKGCVTAESAEETRAIPAETTMENSAIEITKQRRIFFIGLILIQVCVETKKR